VLPGALPADSLRATLRQVFAGRDFQWMEPRNPFRALREALSRVLEWLSALYAAHPVAYFVLMAGLVVLLAALLTHLAYVVWRAMRAHPPEGVGPRAPQPALHDSAWHLAEARRLIGDADYARALGHRYLALVLDLERRRALRYHPSKTPAEYVAEARLEAAGRNALDTLTRALYRHLFGGVPCAADDWTRFDHSASQLAGHATTR
jgi:hypothetical protein